MRNRGDVEKGLGRLGSHFDSKITPEPFFYLRGHGPSVHLGAGFWLPAALRLSKKYPYPDQNSAKLLLHYSNPDVMVLDYGSV